MEIKMNIACTVAQARRFLEHVDRIRNEIDSEIRRLRGATKNVSIRMILNDGRRTAFIREVSALPLFDNVEILATMPVGSDWPAFVEHVIERARVAVNVHALASGSDLVMGD